MKNQTQPLSQKDIKTIRSEKRMGYVFASLVFTTGAFVSMVLALLMPGALVPVVITILATLALSILVMFVINRKHNLDIRNGYKQLKQAILFEKEKTVSYEAGSGMLYIPILADIVPKWWGQKMRPSDKFYFIVEGEQYEVDEDIYNKVEPQSPIGMCYTSVGNNFLGISLPN